MTETDKTGPGADPVIETLLTDDLPPAQEADRSGARSAEKPEGKSGAGHNIKAMLNVGLNVQIVLGHSRMPIAQLLTLSRGSVIELDKKIGEPVDVMINDRLVARGELVKIADSRIGVTLTEIVRDYVSDL
ncbi:flagellar motor switch protein FliN [Tabrizicola sp. WMC-M-20]|nr:flagellar motor switch protein FliN [Tabrizicola sp. WMC-M-20]